MNEISKKTIYAFDLDGTVTREETLPLIAEALGLAEEMRLLTKLTLDGTILFDQSFRLRFHVLNGIPLERIQEIMRRVSLDPAIEHFIQTHASQCAIVTGNLNYWIQPLEEHLKCRFYSSTGKIKQGDYLELSHILRKSEAIRDLRKYAERIVVVGDSFNDIPMFEEADVSIAYGGVHSPVRDAIENADYVVYKGETLCKLLKML